jgi:hypothetical protein
MTALQYSGIEKMELYLNHLPNRKIWAASGDYKMGLLDIPEYASDICRTGGA